MIGNTSKPLTWTIINIRNILSRIPEQLIGKTEYFVAKVSRKIILWWSSILIN